VVEIYENRQLLEGIFGKFSQHDSDCIGDRISLNKAGKEKKEAPAMTCFEKVTRLCFSRFAAR